MAFEDSLIGSSDFDPRVATEDLIRHVSDEPLPSTLEIRDLNTRLGRKIGRTPKAATPSPKTNQPLDLSQFEPVAPTDPKTDQPLDTSQLEPVNPPPAPAAAPSLGVGGNLNALAKGALHGLYETPGSIMQGLGTTGALAQRIPGVQQVANANDASEQFAGILPPEDIARAKEQEAARDVAARSVDDNALVKAGKTVKDFADKAVPMSDAEKQSLGGRVGEGVGGVAPYVAAGAVLGPITGIAAGAVGMGAAAAGDAFEEAIKKGADEETAAKVAGLNGLVGAAAGGIPLAVVLKPIRIISPAIAGKAATMLNDAIQSGIAFASIGEAQHYLAQKIAKENYDPKAGYDLDTQRLLASFITGAIVGGGHSLLKKEPEPARSSPDEVADFLKRANATDPNNPDAGTRRGAEWRSEIDDALAEKAAADAAKDRETALTVPGEPVAEQQTSSVQEQPTSKPQAEGAPETPTSTSTAPPQDHREYATLREYGYSDEDIGNMSATQRRREAVDAVAEGIDPAAAMANHPLPTQPAPASEAPVDRGGAAGTREEPGFKKSTSTSIKEPEVQPTTTATGTRDDPITPQNAADVAKLTPVEPKSPAQAEAENYQHSHAELPHLGLTGAHSVSVETGKGQTRKGVGPDGKPWEVVLENAYGRIKGTKGADGQPLDIVIGDHPDSPHVFVIDQHHPGGAGFDEHKIFAGMLTPQEALKAYGNMYDDQGGDRIGGAVALTPAQFQSWAFSGNTTGPLAKPPSSEPVKAGEGGQSSTEAAAGATDATVPKGSPVASGADTTRPAALSQETDESSVRSVTEEPHKSVSGEVIPPGRVYAEPTAEHHAQIEAVLGQDYHRVAEVDIQRAAELMAEHEGMTPATAFGQAVIENAVDQKFLTHQQAEEAYGPEVKKILDTGREGASGGGEHAVEGGTESEQERPGGAEEGSVIPSGSEAGEVIDAAEAADAGQQPEANEPATDTTGGGAPAKPETTVEQPAAGEAAEHQPAAETTEQPEVKTRLQETIDRSRKAADKINQREAEREKKRFAELETEEKARIEDAGEKIGGARKDEWIGRGLSEADLDKMTGAERDKHLTKHNIWERPDYVAAVADGVDPVAAALIKRLYDKLPVKPNTDRYYKDDAGPAFIKALNAVRDIVAKVKTVDDAKAISNAVEIKLGYTGQSVLFPKGARSNPLYFDGADLRAAKNAVGAGFPEAAPWTRLFMVKEWLNNKPGEFDYYVYRKNGGRVGMSHASKELAEAAAKAEYDKLGEDRKKGAEEPKRPHLDKITRDGPDYRKGKDVDGNDFIKDFGFRGVEFGNYVASDERQKVVNLAYDALHDLARALNVPAKALSLDGTLAVAFGSRGRGGRAAAHYEADRTVINMTKLSGAGSLAHEWGHALDHYLGELGTPNAYKGKVRSISGWDETPRATTSAWNGSRFQEANRHLPLKLRSAVNRLMHELFNVAEADHEFEVRMQHEIEAARKGQQSWIDHASRIKRSGKRAGLTRAEQQIEVWGRFIERKERQLEAGERKMSPSNYLKQATALSGTTGDYWRRPNEMFARSFESYVFDKIAAEGFQSDYLVQGVEPNRFGNGFKGNPYPAGDERKAINSAYDRVVRAIAVGEGKLGEGTRIQSAEGEPEPVETVTRVKRPVAQPSAESEAEAVSPVTLPGAFYDHFSAGRGFSGILEARKFAKEKGFELDPKEVEEAIEFGVVKAARWYVDQPSFTPSKVYAELVHLYNRQPRLGTRTSTSVRDQAYSTPAPLGYLAQRLAGITKDTTVYEPTAGNGALLTTTDPAKVFANELNPERAQNLRDQGFRTTDLDASDEAQGEKSRQHRNKEGGVDAVIANPPFGPVKENGESKVFDLRAETGVPYRTTEIDHAIALRSLEAMKDDGRAVLILGGVNKMVSTPEGRADAYQGQSKRLFYKALYDNYGVTDHFTVDGSLYERQGAGWPVDVVVINGRGKSALPLPAVSAPRIYKSWDELGGLINGQQAASGVRPAGDQAGVAPESRPGLEVGGGSDRGESGGGRAGLEQPGGVRQQSGTETAGAGAQSGVTRAGTEGLGQGVKPARSGEQPALTADEIGDIFDDLIGKKKPTAERPKREAAPRDERSTPEVAKSAAKKISSGADKAMQGLTDLFGGGKTVGMGLAFDEETYKKAKPMFEEAVKDFGEAGTDIRTLMQRLIDHLRAAYKWADETLENAKKYIVRFIQDVQSGAVKLGTEEADPARKEALTGTAIETEGQVTYKPASKTKQMDTLAPRNMAEPMAESLRRLESRVGPVDEYVATQLGYDRNKLEDYFGAEQIDALGLAIDNLERGKGFIIGDQTGIGKGRVNAAIIRWAIKHDRVPVFVTMTPDLYKDMYRDLMDTGITDDFLDKKPRILATNASLDLPLEEGKGAAIKNGDAKEHNKHLMEVAGNIGQHYDMVFSTYAQMQTQKGENTARRAFLQQLAAQPGGIVLIFDESHNAGGQTKARADKSAPMDRAEFARDLIQRANGVFYSSATYAKRPEVMDLYASTNMSMAVDNIADLAEAILHGRVPMQQAVASMLAKDGQYMRRERSFAGIDYNTKTVPVDRESYNEVASGMAAIHELSPHVKAAAKNMSAQMRAGGEALGADNATGAGGASSTSFTSVMHNVVNQMLLAMKADQAADHAIALIKKGEKPVLTVANTMESFMTDYSNAMGLVRGGEMPGDFADVLMKYLDRTRTILIKKPFKEKGEKSERHYLTDAELGPAGLAVYNRAKGIIKGLDLSGLPISPIDYIKGRLKKAGYETGEITGRTLAVDYSGKTPIFTNREGSERTTKGKVSTLKRFNTLPKNGGLHALVINQSGSTGISAHASVGFNDQSKRHMIVVQPEANIDTHMQLLGRINRTGQVVLPEYTQMQADIPAEIRPASVLAKKMASLNANTTAARDSAVTSKEALDFLNEYGDEIAAQWVRDNYELHHRLGGPISISETGVPEKGDAMRKLTGRIPMLPLEVQESLYEELTGAYRALIEQLEAAGESALEAKSLDLKAKLLEKTEVQGKRNNSGSQFAAPVYIQKVSVTRQGKPFTPSEVLDRVSEALGGTSGNFEEKEKAQPGTLANMLKQLNEPYSTWGKEAQKKETAERNTALKAFADYMRPLIDEQETPELRTKKMNQLNLVKDRWTAIHRAMPIGRRVVLKTDAGNLIGIVLDVTQRGEPKNPLALGTWQAKVAIADASRQITVPFSQLHEVGKANPDSPLDIEVEPMTDWYERHEQTLDRFQSQQSEAREERYIAGGNMLAAYDWLGHKGAIVNYTSDKGTVHQGILTARGFDPGKQAIAKGRIASDPVEIKKYLDEHPSEQMMAKDGFIGIQKDGRYGSDYVITAEKAKSRGGVYFLDKKLTGLMGDFQSRGGKMIGYVSPRVFEPVIKQMQALGAEFKMASSLQRPMESEGGEEPTLAKAGTRPDGGLILTPEQRKQIEDAARAAIKRLVGDHVKVDFAEGPMEVPGSAGEKWGDAAVVAHGVYRPWRKLIQLALTHDLADVVPHEAYHAIEYQLQTPAERTLMERETPRLRQQIRKDNRYNMTPEQVDALAGEEIRAIGFEDYVAGRMSGMHVGVKRWYQRLWDALKGLAAKLRGIKPGMTAEDIFGKAYEGGYADATGNTPRPEAMGEALAAIRPGGARPGPNTASETIAQHLRDRGYDRLAGLSQKLGIGKANTTEIRTKLQDKFIRVKNAERSVDPSLPSAQSAYQAESLYHGRTGERLEALEKDHFDPLIKEMHTRDISPGEFNEYLYAKHAPERNAYIDTINPNLGGSGSGMSDTDAAHVIDTITRAGKLADYQAAERLARKIIDDTRDTMVAYGLISQETADAWAAQYQDYVPLRGFEEGSEDEHLMGQGSGYSIKGKESKPAFGRRSMAAGPLQYIMQQAESAIVRGEKNRVGNTFLRFVRNNPDPDRWQVNAPTIRKKIDPATGLVTSYADFREHNEPHKFVTKIGGKPMVISLYGKDGLQIARALKNMGNSNMGAVVGTLHAITSIQSRLSTMYNPNFLLPNFARDLGEAFINLQAQDQQRFVTNFAKHILPAVKGAFNALRGAGHGEEYADAFREFDKAGGRIRFFGMSDPDNIAKNVSRKMRQLQGGTINNARSAAHAASQALEVVQGAIENGTRLAAYMAAKQAGMTNPDAAMLARNLTVDFNKKGEWGPAINALYMFGNVNIQGGMRLSKALLHKRVRQAAYGLAAMGALGALYNILVGGDDDDGDPYYSKIKPYIRDKNMILMWPKGMGHDGKYLKIPLPFGFSPFHVIGDRTMGVALGKDKVSAAASGFLGSLGDAFNPLGEESSPWMMLVPSLLRPGIHIATNKNWTGNALYPEHDYDKNRPDATKSFKSNSDFSKWSAEKLNALSGGSPYKSGWMDFHPGSIDHVLETIGGGLGKFVMDVVKTGGAFIKGEPFDETKAPIIRRFVGSAKDPVSDAQSYYESRDEARKAGGQNLAAARKDMRSGKNATEAESYVQENPKAQRGDSIFKQADKQMKPLRNQLERIEASSELSDDQKRREKEVVTERMRTIQNTARKRYKEMKAGGTPTPAPPAPIVPTERLYVSPERASP